MIRYASVRLAVQDMDDKITFAKFIDILSISRKSPTYIFLPELLDAFTDGKLNRGELGLPNLCDEANPNTLKAKANGKREISKEEATVLLENFDYDSLETYFNDLISNVHLVEIRNAIVRYGFKLNSSLDDSLIPEVCAKLMKKIIYNLSIGKKETLPPLEYLDFKSLSSTAIKAAEFKNGDLYINGEKMPVSKKLAQMNIEVDGDLIFVKKLFEAYSEALGRKVSNQKDLIGTIYERHVSEHTKFYFEARYKENAARELFDEGESEFESIKKEIEEGIFDALYYGKYENGIERITNVMNTIATNLQLNSSLLLNIRGFINVSTRKGILHILVEKGRIKSWVNPNE